MDEVIDWNKPIEWIFDEVKYKAQFVGKSNHHNYVVKCIAPADQIYSKEPIFFIVNKNGYEVELKNFIISSKHRMFKNKEKKQKPEYVCLLVGKSGKIMLAEQLCEAQVFSSEKKLRKEWPGGTDDYYGWVQRIPVRMK